MDPLERLQYSHAEYAAWMDVVSLLRAQGIDLNAPSGDKLAEALKVWGEKLAELRRVHPYVVER